MVAVSEEHVWSILATVMDPEVPVLNVVEMGIVRSLELLDNGVCVVLTPTYSGCPAMKAIEDGVLAALRGAGLPNPSTRTQLSPPWTTDWITEAANEKLRAYGIAPPTPQQPLADGVPCPFCSSRKTTLRSSFGSTACKAFFYCDECLQPFEHFKCV